MVTLCTRYCIEHLNTFCDWSERSQKHVLRWGLSLPSEICEGMLRVRLESDVPLDDAFLKLFGDPQSTRLRRVSVRNCSSVTDDGLLAVLAHRLLELDVSNCPNVTSTTLGNINDNGEELVSLIVGNSVHILPEVLNGDDAAPGCRERGYVINLPNLKRLVIRDWEERLEPDYLSLLFRPLSRQLTHLDLSGCLYLGNPIYFLDMTNLRSLILYSVPNLQDIVPFICQLKSLRHLDISQHGDKLGVVSNPNQVLATIVNSLPHLSSLDISGTNLAGTGVAESDCDEDFKEGKKASTTVQPPMDIPGLRTRVSCPLDFLGLLNTTNDACHRHHIPAKRITGDANEMQILTAAKAYLDRPEVLQKVLNDLFHLFRYEWCQNSMLALKLILQAMQQHLSEKHIQISGSASLFYIVKGDDSKKLNIKVKKLIIKTLLDAMCEHEADPTMMRNGCLTLCNFQIPQDVLFDYCRLVGIVLRIVSVENQDEFVQRISIYLLNSLACQVDGCQKQLVGELCAIEIMLKLIDWRLQRQLCDEVMEIAWSTMWNVTDETPVNCRRFLDGQGMTFFLKCLQTFPNKPELLRNMMGLLGNVAEVEDLRCFLMTSEYLQVFSNLLDSNSDGIEVSYNAAGVLSHIASNGPAFWTVTSPSRKEVLDRMSWAVERWDVNTKRNINYRSFEPIFRLLKVKHTPEAQYWAAWALANLTKVYPEKYCKLVIEEEGLQMLEEIDLQDLPLCRRIKGLVQVVIDHCERFGKCGSLEDNPEDDVAHH